MTSAFSMWGDIILTNARNQGSFSIFNLVVLILLLAVAIYESAKGRRLRHLGLLCSILGVALFLGSTKVLAFSMVNECSLFFVALLFLGYIPEIWKGRGE